MRASNVECVFISKGSDDWSSCCMQSNISLNGLKITTVCYIHNSHNVPTFLELGFGHKWRQRAWHLKKVNWHPDKHWVRCGWHLCCRCLLPYSAFHSALWLNSSATDDLCSDLFVGSSSLETHWYILFNPQIIKICYLFHSLRKEWTTSLYTAAKTFSIRHSLWQKNVLFFLQCCAVVDPCKLVSNVSLQSYVVKDLAEI